MVINDKTCLGVDRRVGGGNYTGVERRRNLGPGAYVMMTIHRWTFYGILVLNVVMAVSLINLTLFAKQGRRYTWDNGDVERAERIQGDADLHARIDSLHPQHGGHE